MSDLSILASLSITAQPQPPDFWVIFFALVCGHAVADFALQGEYIALHKSRHYRPSDGKKREPGEWIYVLSAHSLIHAAAVWLITGSVVLALIELVLHWLTDFAKCEGWTNLHADQAIHVGSKAAYALWLASQAGGMTIQVG